MNLTDIESLKKLLSRFHVRLSPSRGQHFLIDSATLQAIVAAAELQPDDVVVEIGAGVGTLTAELGKACRAVVAYEVDRRLLPVLRFAVKPYPSVRILNQNFLTANLAEDLATCNLSIGYKVVANIPYQVTGKILRLLLTQTPRPRQIVLLVQKEVAQRITAGPGQMSVLAASVQFYGNPEMVAIVARDDFFPAPAVDSAILKIDVLSKPRLAVDEKDFFRLVKIGFSSRRKTLLNNLSAGYHLPKETVVHVLQQAGLRATLRAQELDLEAWRRLLVCLEQRIVTYEGG